MILIGSSAIKHWYSDFNRIPKDLDYIVKGDKKSETNGIEYLYNPILENIDLPILPPQELTTLKASHLFWNIDWEKHMFDLQFLLSKGNKIDENLFNRLYLFWNDYHGKNKRSDLKMNKNDFFNNEINYNNNEHDETHKKLNKKPIYSLILKDGKEVELCENKYNKLSHNQKISLIKEEVMVMAYERFKHLGYKIAYHKMLKKFIISHAPIFTLIFILENYKELIKPNFNFIKQIENEF